MVVSGGRGFQLWWRRGSRLSSPMVAGRVGGGLRHPHFILFYFILGGVHVGDVRVGG